MISIRVQYISLPGAYAPGYWLSSLRDFRNQVSDDKP